MRDTVKNREYFLNYLEYENDQISKRELRIKETTDSEKAQRILLNLCNNRFNVFVASFSAGASEEELNELLRLYVSNVTERKQITYNQLLTASSLSIILDNRECASLLFNKFGDAFDDALISGLFSYIIAESPKWGEGNLAFPDEYSKLYEATQAASDSEKADLLSDYLKDWKESNGYLFDTADREDNVYKGAWCFEAAAIAKVLGLGSSYFSNYSFFPQL